MPRLQKPLCIVTALLLLFGSTSCKKKAPSIEDSGMQIPPVAGSPASIAAGFVPVDPIRGVTDNTVHRVLDGSLKLRDDATVYDVTYTPETVLMSLDSVKQSLKQVSEDGATYTFDSSSGDAQKLHEGSVMLLTGIALRKVTATTLSGGSLVVTTGPAAITDAIANGNIEAKTHVDFGTMAAAIESAPHPGWTLVKPVYAQGKGKLTPDAPLPLTFSMSILPFSYTIAFTKAAGQINITMTVSDTTANLAFQATGYIKNYDQLLAIGVQNGKISKLDFTNSNLDSELTVTWSAASLVSGPMNKILSWTKMVQTLFPKLGDLAATYPFVIGPIPFTLKVTSGITFVPAFTSKNTVMTGSLKLHYSGGAGFTVANGASQPSGTITPEAPKNPLTKILSLGPLGFTVAVEFPRLELGIGLTFVTFSPAAYISPVTSFGIVYGGPAAMLPCETHILDLSVSTGISTKSTIWSFLGNMTSITVDKQIYKKNWTGPKPGMMLCPT